MKNEQVNEKRREGEEKEQQDRSRAGLKRVTEEEDWRREQLRGRK